MVSTSTSTTQSGIGTLSLTNGTAKGKLTSLPAGTYQLTAEYGGDVNFAASNSNPVNLTVTPEGSSIAISGKYIGVTSTGNNAPVAPTSNGMTAPYDSFFAIDAKVFGASSTAANPDGIPTGIVTVLDNGQVITTLNLADNSVVELETGSLGAGKHALTFAYGGDGSFMP